MYGVVLWSDTADQRAVFWCEDHGDLAIYLPGPSRADGLHAGDLVEFDVRAARPMRCAYNARLVSQDYFHHLPESLLSRGSAGVAVSPRAVQLSLVMADAAATGPEDLDDEAAWEALSDAEEDAAEQSEPDQPCASNVVPFRPTGLPRKRG
ncbi:hypothetical protein KDD17_05775 [Sulfitobacter albidus]|uniref:Uncharacterized protein n=1 Tax=Sulfitobacter albidus TaxID=2829501 RepID=A0A975JFH5_9RHOB|nr:hypothetical protein [Sulfitobacter albidus]QUJ77498.1 hypothetical protein KDD17_05775 [Sulfitobacter albidus]